MSFLFSLTKDTKLRFISLVFFGLTISLVQPLLFASLNVNLGKASSCEDELIIFRFNICTFVYSVYIF